MKSKWLYLLGFIWGINSCSGAEEVLGECGNGVLEPGEACDGGDFGDKTCVSESFLRGNLICDPATCQISTAQCVAVEAECGNGERDNNEECDGLDTGGALCPDSTARTCNDDCTLAPCNSSSPNNTSPNTQSCTDGIQNQNEVGVDCGGVCAACRAVCGNAILEMGESCEPDLPAQDTCQSLGFIEGVVGCRSADCSYDTSGCVSNECPRSIVRVGLRDGSLLETNNLTAAPLDTIRLDGSSSFDPDGELRRYEWSIVRAPEGFTGGIFPTSREVKPTVFLSLVGTYEFELDVYDALGKRSCSPSRVVVEAIPENDIYVQLRWSTSSDSDETDDHGADLDLHYRHPDGEWNTSPHDIYWRNHTAPWAAPGLVIDDTDGSGPEAIAHSEPSRDRNYTVGVYYYEDHGYGESRATIDVYIDGILRGESNKLLRNRDQFWDVLSIAWPSGSITSNDRVYTGFP